MLTTDQIQSLFKFCEKHYVRYFDLQVELVDHLANAVEERMQQNPKLGFEQALNEVYKGFGVMGFSPVISERLNALEKSRRKLNWQLFLSYFTIPRIATTILLFFILLLPSLYLSPKNIQPLYMVYCLGAALFGIGCMIYLIVKYKKPTKELLMLQGFSVFSLLGSLLQIPNLNYIILRANHIDVAYSLWANVFVLLFSVMMIVLCLAQFEAYKKMYLEAKQNYPLAFAA